MSKAVTVALFILVFALGFFTAGFVNIDTGAFSTSKTGNVVLTKLSGKVYRSEVNIVAVKELGEEGVVSQAEVEISNGEGRILFNTNPFVEPDTQFSIEIASIVAQNFTGKSLEEKDVIYSIANSGARLVGGPSAGAALTVATIAAIEDAHVMEDAAITGTIEPDGRIGEIGGVVEKSIAAANNGIKLFLVPEGQGVFTYYEKEIIEDKRGFLTIRRVNYVPRQINLQDFLDEQGYDIEIREVANISEAVSEMVL